MGHFGKKTSGEEIIVSFAAVIRVVTHRSAVSVEDRCVTTLITVAKETKEITDYRDRLVFKKFPSHVSHTH